MVARHVANTNGVANGPVYALFIVSLCRGCCGDGGLEHCVMFECGQSYDRCFELAMTTSKCMFLLDCVQN